MRRLNQLLNVVDFSQVVPQGLLGRHHDLGVQVQVVIQLLELVVYPLQRSLNPRRCFFNSLGCMARASRSRSVSIFDMHTQVSEMSLPAFSRPRVELIGMLIEPLRFINLVQLLRLQEILAVFVAVEPQFRVF